MNFYGRKVVVSALDPVPDGLRFGPNVVVLNHREIDAVTTGCDAGLIAELQRAMDHYDRERLRRILEDAGR